MLDNNSNINNCIRYKSFVYYTIKNKVYASYK